ncbi:hypothetical protein [Sphingomonas sp. IC081]|uniref:hypothetical protein n=1 Tax=Sphingomonas sp. IC081 TaxID=304378 RepID=UPI00115BEF92|nr:hypothetical protein [Sphingomonas sp. IC081]QDK34632.1 hypothetical protein DM450_17985 [Sphingomonas sp. IC081]
MASSVIERVSETDVWTARLRDFLHDCAGSAPAEEHDRIREAVLLLHDPDGLVGHAFEPAAIAAMLACGAGESAVLAILGPDLNCMISRGSAGSCLATLVLADGSEEVICEGSTLALALLAAYVSMLLAGAEREDEAVSTFTMPAGVRLH